MIATPYIRDCIVDKDKTALDPRRDRAAARRSTACRPSISRSSRTIQKGVITYDDALRYASNKDEFKLKVQGIATTAELARDEMLKASTDEEAEIMRFGG